MCLGLIRITIQREPNKAEGWSCFLACYFWQTFPEFVYSFFLWSKERNGILLPKLFWPTVRKNCSSDGEKLLNFKAFAKFLRSLEQFIQTVKGQNNFWALVPGLRSSLRIYHVSSPRYNFLFFGIFVAFIKNWQSSMGDHMKFGRLKFISNCANLTHAFEFGAIISFSLIWLLLFSLLLELWGWCILIMCVLSPLSYCLAA